jgi:hypothetical protein
MYADILGVAFRSINFVGCRSSAMTSVQYFKIIHDAAEVFRYRQEKGLQIKGVGRFSCWRPLPTWTI